MLVIELLFDSVFSLAVTKVKRLILMKRTKLLLLRPFKKINVMHHVVGFLLERNYKEIFS